MRRARKFNSPTPNGNEPPHPGSRCLRNSLPGGFRCRCLEIRYPDHRSTDARRDRDAWPASRSVGFLASLHRPAESEYASEPRETHATWPPSTAHLLRQVHRLARCTRSGGRVHARLHECWARIPSDAPSGSGACPTDSKDDAETRFEPTREPECNRNKKQPGNKFTECATVVSIGSSIIARAYFNHFFSRIK